MMRKFKFILALLFMAVAFKVSAQQQMPPIPVDKDVRIGKLDNGLTYYIRHNEYPEHRANFYIAQKVGSILEEDSQRGLAHFLEHMCFNGTTHFPGDKLLRYLESHGVKFGVNVNAYTSIDETVYNLDDVPTDHGVGLQDSCLLILHDWSHDLLLEDEEIDKERGVIHEEWRSSTGPAMRMYEKLFPKIFPGSKYAYRLPIGIMDVVDNFPYQVLRDYYHKWYRPDQQGIIVVGDVDVDRIENKIKEIFSDIKMPENPAERVYEPVADNEEAIYAIASDKEQPTENIYLMFKSDAFPVAEKSGLMYLVEQYVENVISMMVNERFDELAQKADAPFAQAFFQYGDYILAKPKDASNFIAIPKTGKDKESLTALMREALRIRNFGFTAGEYDRARQEYLSQLEMMYTNRDKMVNSQFVSQYVRHFLDNEPIPSVAEEYQLMNQLAPSIPLQVINEGVKSLISADDKNMVVMAMCPEKEGFTIPTEEGLRSAVAAARAEKIEAYVDNVKNEPLMATLPTAGKIVKEEEDKDLGTKTWTLSNGIKVISKKTDFREDQVIMNGYSKGGTSVYDDSEMVNINMLNGAISAGGVGNFTRNELTKALSGIQASANPSIGMMYDNINGNCLPKDMETMFQLTHLAFTSPKRDDEGFKALMERQRISLENYDAEPTNAFVDQLRNTLYANNPRVDRLKLEDLDKVNYDRIIEMYKDRMSDAGDFTFIFVGNFDEQKLREYTELYLASLPSTGRNENYVDRHVEYAKGVNENTFSRKMENAQTYVGLFQSGKCEFSIQNRINVSMIAQVMTMIYLEKIREEMGATYSVSTQGELSKETQEFILQTVLPIKPEMKDQVLECLNGTVENLGKNGIEAKYFDKVKEYLQKTYQENQRENSYWSSIIKMKNDDGIDYKKDYLNTLNATTPEMLQKFVNDVILKQGNRTQVIMVPEE